MAYTAILGAIGKGAVGAVNSIPPEVWKLLAAGGVAYMGYRLVKGTVDKAKYNNAVAAVGTDGKKGLAVEYASLLNAAFNNLGWGWFDGTDEDLVYEVATQMFKNGVDFQTVANMYKNVYGDELLQEIDAELDDGEKLKFFNILRGTNNL
ncbi:hypothetical protein [Persicobacter diffluens]|uniref:Uncharacterized protein n=1 Tax=Persicobacter diffluens TaxID=981 RepID=A0AAN5AMC1_9BACT|nr:hypothetical protein PEDI_54520 [Persicobacter diffluens]